LAFHILISLLSAAACWRWGDWKNWRAYYPTVLYFIIGDMIGYILLSDHRLWLYNGWPRDNHFYPDLYQAVCVYPGIIILYLSHFPRHRKDQLVYLAAWVAGYSLYVYMLHRLGLLVYRNGWGIGHDVLFNTVMFPLLRLHYKKPLWVWPVSMALALALMWYFDIPIAAAE